MTAAGRAWGVAALAITAACGDAAGGSGRAPGHQVFRAANLKIEAFGGEVGFGNTEASRKIARRVAELAVEIRAAAFDALAPARRGPERGRFLAYCHMDGDSACLLVRVPEFERYPDVSRRHLVDLLWGLARREVGLALPEDAWLAIGLRGAGFFGAIATGTLAVDGEPTLDVSRYAGSEILYPFFAS